MVQDVRARVHVFCCFADVCVCVRLKSCADCCFVEDTAVVVGRTAVVANIGAGPRQGEEAPVAAALQVGAGIVCLTMGGASFALMHVPCIKP